ncbi:MAG: dihydrodipicolinate synthase family protein [Spirochaetaceae bacterium]|nr:dihydrodipicolinate synthase family protein [Spirochaetaceae bacterium]
MNTQNELRFPSGILATCCIPWNQDFQLDEELFRKSVRSILKHTPLIYIFGTAGEGYAVSREEYTQIVSIFADEMMKKNAKPMVGIINLSLSEVFKRIEIAMELGVKLFQISLPSWGTLSKAESELFFREILSSFPDADFLHYNMKRAGRIISPGEYAELSEQYKNFTGAKITSDSTRYIDELMGLNLPLRFFFTSPGYAYASMLGDCGFLIATASCNWDMAQIYYRAGRTGDRKTILELQGDLGNITRELLSCVGDSGHIDGAYDKMFLKIHIEDFPLRLLPPYSYPPDSAFRQFRDILKKKYTRWYPE